MQCKGKALDDWGKYDFGLAQSITSLENHLFNVMANIPEGKTFAELVEVVVTLGDGRILKKSSEGFWYTVLHHAELLGSGQQELVLSLYYFGSNYNAMVYYVGKYTIQSNEYGEAKYLKFLHTLTYELLKNKYPNDSIGTLFYISCWPVTNEEAVNNMNELTVPLFQTDDFAYFLGKATGVEFDESIPEPWQTTEYKSLAYSAEMIAEIVANAYPIYHLATAE